MKKILIILLAGIFIFPVFTSCEKDEETGTPPVLPPYESMAIDFSDFTDNSKSTTDLKMEFTDLNLTSNVNYGWAGLTVLIWNVTLGSVLAVPVASFYASFNNVPTFIGDATWEWTYNVAGFASTYTARLTGQIRVNDVKWEMYITKTGIGGYDEFKWFEGTSDIDGNGGQWILYHSYNFQDPVLQIDWEKTSGEIGMVKYTYIRETDDSGETETFNGSYLEYGLQEDDYNAYYNVHAYAESVNDFVDTYIEWNTTAYFGHIKAEHIYQDTEWHCWDTDGNDIDCSN